jgi:hypothetical protein
MDCLCTCPFLPLLSSRKKQKQEGLQLLQRPGCFINILVLFILLQDNIYDRWYTHTNTNCDTHKSFNEDMMLIRFRHPWVVFIP